MYESPVYRPPSEAKSLLVQIANGCSYNKCIFCYMYKGVKYKEKTIDELRSHIKDLKSHYKNPEKVFLVGGDVFHLDTDVLIEIIDLLKEEFPTIKRISSYCSTINVLEKSDAQLSRIREAGVSLLYVGLESGSNIVLDGMCKGVTKEKHILACNRLSESGFDLSVMVISGLGGKVFSKEHALETADLINKVSPRYFSLLSLELRSEALHKAMKIRFDFEMMKPSEIINETILMIKHIDVIDCIFRSNHASNYVKLGGVLSEDKKLILENLRDVLTFYSD